MKTLVKTTIPASAVLCLIAVNMVVSQFITQTPCASFNTTPMKNFDKDLYAGLWFMHQYFVSWTDSLKYECYLNVRTPTPDGNQNVSTILINPGLQLKIDRGGVSTFDRPGKGHYIYSSPLNSSWTRTYDILSTDYVTYSIEWNCTEVSSGNQCLLFILSRTPVVTVITQRTIDSILYEHKINKTGLRTLNISACPSQLTQLPEGPGLLEGVLQIVGDLVGVVGGLLGGILG